jgi:hypothetical protein
MANKKVYKGTQLYRELLYAHRVEFRQMQTGKQNTKVGFLRSNDRTEVGYLELFDELDKARQRMKDTNEQYFHALSDVRNLRSELIMFYIDFYRTQYSQEIEVFQSVEATEREETIVIPCI